jgi:hypothetical protein
VNPRCIDLLRRPLSRAYRMALAKAFIPTVSSATFTWETVRNFELTSRLAQYARLVVGV